MRLLDCACPVVRASLSGLVLVLLVTAPLVKHATAAKPARFSCPIGMLEYYRYDGGDSLTRDIPYNLADDAPVTVQGAFLNPDVSIGGDFQNGIMMPPGTAATAVGEIKFTLPAETTSIWMSLRLALQEDWRGGGEESNDDVVDRFAFLWSPAGAASLDSTFSSAEDVAQCWPLLQEDASLAVLDQCTAPSASGLFEWGDDSDASASYHVLQHEFAEVAYETTATFRLEQQMAATLSGGRCGLVEVLVCRDEAPSSLTEWLDDLRRALGPAGLVMLWVGVAGALIGATAGVMYRVYRSRKYGDDASGDPAYASAKAPRKKQRGVDQSSTSGYGSSGSGRGSVGDARKARLAVEHSAPKQRSVEQPPRKHSVESRGSSGRSRGGSGRRRRHGGNSSRPRKHSTSSNASRSRSGSSGSKAERRVSTGSAGRHRKGSRGSGGERKHSGSGHKRRKKHKHREDAYGSNTSKGSAKSASKPTGQPDKPSGALGSGGGGSGAAARPRTAASGITLDAPAGGGGAGGANLRAVAERPISTTYANRSDAVDALINLMARHTFALVDALAFFTPNMESEALGRSLIELFARRPLQASRLLTWVVEHEMRSVTDADDVFRSSSLTTRMLIGFVQTAGHEWMVGALAPTVRLALEYQDSLELDANLGTSNRAALASNAAKLGALAKHAARGLVDALPTVPTALAELSLTLKAHMTKKLGSAAPSKVLTELLFLRFLIPAWNSPHKHSLTDRQAQPTSAQRRNLLLVSKILQSAANVAAGASLTAKEAYMEDLQPVVQEIVPMVQSLVTGIAKAPERNGRRVSMRDSMASIPPPSQSQCDVAVRHLYAVVDESAGDIAAHLDFGGYDTPGQQYMAELSVILDTLGAIPEKRKRLASVALERRSIASFLPSPP